jgi:hypothetical protein
MNIPPAISQRRLLDFDSLKIPPQRRKPSNADAGIELASFREMENISANNYRSCGMVMNGRLGILTRWPFEVNRSRRSLSVHQRPREIVINPRVVRRAGLCAEGG